jgi:hypothetical protein
VPNPRVLALAALVMTAVPATATAHRVAAPTMAASARMIPFGSDVVLKGTAPGAKAGDRIEILAKACGFTEPVPVGATHARKGGAYTYTLQPMLNAAFSVRWGETTSKPISIRVRPAVQVRRVNATTFGIDVSSGNGAWFDGSAILQRWNAGSRSWITAGSAPLSANSSPDALIAVSSATVHATIKRGARMRAVVPQSTVGECYVSSASAAVTS